MKMRRPFDPSRYHTPEEILEYVRWEDEVDHAFDPRPAIPRYRRAVIMKNKPGWNVLFRDMLKYSCKQLMP